MDTSGTEFRVAGIVDTGGSEDSSIIYATNVDVNKLTGTRAAWTSSSIRPAPATPQVWCPASTT